ncbi:Nramp family divalent metal transporter [Dyadobacter sp. CY323]|uniref:Nramp family divalent metal transporter n=1 Tax=Dyadobacter sp. CY323 TaxID=2907302 RepID=UPI001F339C7A|nr:Nramp family divalent metal transporter [Dyadobacter sp. CY323]MCE6990124.1 Nramp family divalent metal transporter [Dyadobacter sp. CY323]
MENSKSGVLRWLKSLGPGMITAALVFGPSKLTITSKLGAVYGYSLLWIVLVAILFMAVFTSMSTRIGVATNQSFLASVKQKWGKGASVAIGIGVFLVTTSFQAGNSVGVGIAAGELNNTSPVPWIIFFNLVGISLLFFRSFYSVLERTMIILIFVKLFSFVTTFFWAKPDVAKIVKGFTVPTLPEGSQGLIIAFVASCFSIVGALYQSYLIQERIRLKPELRTAKNDSTTGIILLGCMCSIVIICAAAILNPKGIAVNSATDMAKALEPIFGSNATTLFLVGLFGAAFSSLIGNASVGGTLLGDALGLGSNFSSKSVRYLVALVMVIGASIAIRFGKLPLELIVFAQSVTIFVVPFIGTALYMVGNDKKIMGDKVNSPLVKVVAGLGLIVIFSLAIINTKELFFNNPLFK